MLDRLTVLLFDFAFFYPLLMSYLWMTGALLYYSRYERGKSYANPPQLPEYPLVSVLVPCYNESSNAIETFTALAELFRYHDRAHLRLFFTVQISGP